LDIHGCVKSDFNPSATGPVSSASTHDTESGICNTCLTVGSFN